jgi:P-type E1-E2 ATPase
MPAAARRFLLSWPRFYQQQTIMKLDIPRFDKARILVVGDVMRLKAGDAIACDGVLLTANELTIDESMVTGESNAKPKDLEKDQFVTSPSVVVEGKYGMPPEVPAVRPVPPWATLTG